jgi:hypothetical protein
MSRETLFPQESYINTPWNLILAHTPKSPLALFLNACAVHVTLHKTCHFYYLMYTFNIKSDAKTLCHSAVFNIPLYIYIYLYI